MINKEQAMKLVLDYVTRNGEILQDNPPYIVDEKTIELPYGWVFFWTSKKFSETGNVIWAYLGNSPLLVDKFDATIKALAQQ